MANFEYRGFKVIVHCKDQSKHQTHADAYPYWAEILGLGQVPHQREYHRLRFIAHRIIDEWIDKGVQIG